MIWTWIVLAGILTGLRSFMPLAVLTLFLHHHTIRLGGTPLAFLHTMWAHILLVLLALGELVGDKLPKTPSRKSALGLSGRVILGAVVGAALAMGTANSWWAGALLGVAGAIVGTYGGWFVRTRAVAALHCPDWVIAVIEDVITIAGSIFVMSRVAGM